MRIFVARRALDRHLHKLGRPLSIPHHQLRQILRKRRQLVPKRGIRLSIRLLVNLRRRNGAGAIRQRDNRIIGRHIAVHADRVEAPVHGVGERRLETPRRDGRIRHDAREKRRMQQPAMRAGKPRRRRPPRGPHTRVDHPSPLVHPREPVRLPPHAKRPRPQFGKRIRRHKRPRDVFPCGKGGREGGRGGFERGQGGEDGGDGDVLANDARGHDERLARAWVASFDGAEELVRRFRHLPCIFQPPSPRHGVCTPAIDHDRPGPPASRLQNLLRNEHRRRFEGVARKARRCGGGAR